MTPEVLLISTPSIDMTQFLRVTSRALGYDPARAVDSSPRSLSDYEKFVNVLSCYHNDDNLKRPVSEIIADSASICAHLSFSVLFIADRETIFKSMERSGLNHTVADGLTGTQLAYVSGTLQQWKSATLECCHPDSSHDLRLLYDKVVILFETMGLKVVWSNTKKKSTKDGTFLLEHKS